MIFRYCPKCKDHVEAAKKFDVWKLPKILVVHLKRFQYNRYQRDKIETLVEFPITGLDLQKYVIDPNYKHSTKYDLIGICNHMGHLGGGHCEYLHIIVLYQNQRGIPKKRCDLRRLIMANIRPLFRTPNFVTPFRYSIISRDFHLQQL